MPFSQSIDVAGAAVVPILSLPEKYCLQMVAEGRKLQEISDLMAMTAPDVESLMSAIEDKLGASNRLHAISIAMRQGYVAL